MRNLVFSQLERSQQSSMMGDEMQGIGEELISVDAAIAGDFEIRCMWYSTVPVQVGEAICLHTAFVEEDLFIRVPVTGELHLDLIFQPANAQTFSQGKNDTNDTSSNSSNESLPAFENKDAFWQALSLKIKQPIPEPEAEPNV